MGDPNFFSLFLAPTKKAIYFWSDVAVQDQIRLPTPNADREPFRYAGTAPAFLDVDAIAATTENSCQQ
jgi:hypothetical protein